MNLVLDEAEEVRVKKNSRKQLGEEGISVVFLTPLIYDYLSCMSINLSLSCLNSSNVFKLPFFFLLGRILLKGDNITLMMNT